MPNVPADKAFDPSDSRYLALFNEAKQKILSTRIQIAKTVCKKQLDLYWWLGQQIVEVQEKYGWGKSIVEHLAKDFSHIFPNSTYGFSARNLWEMRLYYLAYRDYPNLQQVVAEIPWGQNLLILHKVKDIKAREYYLKSTQQMGWTRDVLSIQISSQAYERHILARKQHNFEQALPQHLAEQADHTLKDVYMLDTLGLTQPVMETQLETRMVNKIKNVMLELGYGFAFLGNQYRIAHEGGEHFIDLLFFNRKLKSLVAMELKIGKFLPEYAGKMNFYLNLLDDYVRETDENPSIGIILCSERSHFDVEYTLREIKKPIGVSEFRLTRELPIELSGILPNPTELKKELLKEFGAPTNTCLEHST